MMVILTDFELNRNQEAAITLLQK